MPSVALQLSRLRRPWWKRPTTIGVAAISLCASPLLLAGWLAVAPQRGLPEGDEPAPATMTAMRDFRRAPLDADAMASIVRGNVLSSTRSEFSRPEETPVVQAPQQDRGGGSGEALEDARATSRRCARGGAASGASGSPSSSQTPTGARTS